MVKVVIESNRLFLSEQFKIKLKNKLLKMLSWGQLDSKPWSSKESKVFEEEQGGMF